MVDVIFKKHYYIPYHMQFLGDPSMTSRPILVIFTSYRSRDVGLSNALLVVRIDQVFAEYQSHLNWY